MPRESGEPGAHLSRTMFRGINASEGSAGHSQGKRLCGFMVDVRNISPAGIVLTSLHVLASGNIVAREFFFLEHHSGQV